MPQLRGAVVHNPDQPQRPTIYDVARLAGVSYQTVSRFVNGADGVRPANRSRIENAIRLLGYHRNEAARSLAGAPTATIALLATGSHDERQALFVRGVHRCAWTTGQVVVSVVVDAFSDTSGRGLERAMQMLADRRPRGVIVLCPRAEYPVVHAALRHHGLPSVVVQIDGRDDHDWTDRAGDDAVAELLAATPLG